MAESYPILLEGLNHLFRSAPGFSVLACCKDGDETWRALQIHHPDVLVMDLRISGTRDALTILREITQKALAVRVVLLAGHLNYDEMLEATRLGARGMVLKSMPSYLLVQCVRKVHRGGIWVEKLSMAKAFDRVLRPDTCGQDASTPLSTRELEILRMVAQAKSNKEISEKLYICVGTVKSHLHHVYEKLGVKGRLELLLYARNKGLLSDPASNGISSQAR
jgi:DNA-binding NarL/FixJ family response regulator